jgi:hypothetical protein
MFKVYSKKIDIYLKSLKGDYQYECSTNAARTCKEAKEKFCLRHSLDKGQVKANFAR